ncbi:lipid storage droplets surface-binding protein 2-like isoform X1 [Rhynchophorus ferrugineus]|uniref:Uncharacterized protein n=1 Tax=Rhynchophorus ferrugineus TaxID=354439 RepID=A0A834IPN1_RHYFE|nr:hypothetical protein GWI33_009283 [Rhynchophorus ferrugineus]
MASQSQNVADVAVQPHPTCMESVNRIVKLPAVEQTIQTVHDIYGKVKDYNNLTNWTLQTAEDTVNKAVTVGKPYATPVIKNLEGPIKKVDDVLCTGLDYVEAKVPAVKLPPKELISQIYTSTKDYVTSHVNPAVESAKAYVEPAVKTAKDIVEPAVKTAKDLVEPVVENVKFKVDGYLQKNVEQETEEKTGPTSADVPTNTAHTE